MRRSNESIGLEGGSGHCRVPIHNVGCVLSVGGFVECVLLHQIRFELGGKRSMNEF